MGAVNAYAHPSEIARFVDAETAQAEADSLSAHPGFRLSLGVNAHIGMRAGAD